MVRLILAIVVFAATQSVAQSTRLNTDVKGIIYNKEKAVEARVHTHGWTANFLMGDIKSYYKK